MKSVIVTAIFLLAGFSSVNAQTIIKDNKEKTSLETAEVSSFKSDRVKASVFPDPQATPTPAPAANSANWYTRPTAKKRLNRYVLSMVGPVALAKDVVSAGYSTWRNSPEEWGDRWEGFGRRVASSFGTGVIKQTTIYSLDEAFKIDSSYYRSRKKDFGSKVSNALLSVVTARDRDGKRVFGGPRIAGTYLSSGLARELWYPSRFSFKDGFKSGSVSLGLEAAFNLVKEFVWKK
jgi:hypothetical protein